jgi:hypothetical protein
MATTGAAFRGVAASAADGRAGRTGAVLAVTAARPTTAKRGFAFALGRAFTRLAGASVCVVDADVNARDATRRTVIGGRTVRELAAAGSGRLLELVGRDPASGCWYVPIGNRRELVDGALYADVVRRLRDEVDVVIVDAPVGFATLSRRIDHLVHDVDQVVVATPAVPAEVPAVVDYLNVLGRDRLLGEVPPMLELCVVPTGDDPQAGAWFAERIANVPVAGVVPRTWGRAAAAQARTREVPPSLAALVEMLAASAAVG